MPNELFDESHYFICSGGLKPASLKASQHIAIREDEASYYLIETSLKCKGVDFSCKWVALLCAIIVALMAVLLSCPAGWVLLAAIAGAAGGAAIGAALCGDKAAIARVWVVLKNDALIGDKQQVANRPGPHLTCSAFNATINYAPNIHNEFHAWVLFLGNIGMTGLEGFMYAYAFRGAGMLLTKPLQFFANFGANYLKTLSVQGVLGRTVFAAWGGFSAYSNSQTEGYNSKKVLGAAGQGFGFMEVAAYNAATKHDPESIALLLASGGVPGGKSSKDATFEDVSNTAQSTAKGWENPVETIKSDVKNTINAAKELKDRLLKQNNGKGGHEENKSENNENKSPKEEPPFNQELRDLVKADAEKLSKLHFDERGPVVARAYDTKTGKISESYTNVKEVPKDLDPLLQERVNILENTLKDVPKKDWPHFSDPGTHAEVRAVNELLKARRAAGETVTQETLNDIITDQYWLEESARRPNNGINPAPTCAHCTNILHGTYSQAGKK